MYELVDVKNYLKVVGKARTSKITLIFFQQLEIFDIILKTSQTMVLCNALVSEKWNFKSRR